MLEVYEQNFDSNGTGLSKDIKNNMVTIIIVTLFIIIFILFLLSALGPMHSQKKFWIVIRKIRSVMDFGSYWFYNLCAIATIVYIVFMVIYDLVRK